MTLTVLREGRPLAGTKVNTVDVNLVGDELTTDAGGQVVYTPPATGVYSIYTQFVDKTPGEADGKHYDEIREFASLAFTWPLLRSDADPEAVKLFEQAVAARAQWNNFPGFKASLEGSVDGRTISGDVTVAADGTVEIDAADEPVADWVREQLESIAMHRIASTADSAGDSHPVLRFADDDESHPFGRLLAFDGGRFASSYRIKDGQITVVNRHFGAGYDDHHAGQRAQWRRGLFAAELYGAILGRRHGPAGCAPKACWIGGRRWEVWICRASTRFPRPRPRDFRSGPSR